MTGLGVGEIVVLVCLCGFLGIGILVLIGLSWIMMMGQRNHGELADLNHDDHPQYLTVERGDPRYALQEHAHGVEALSDVDAANAMVGDVLVRAQNQWVARSLPDTGEASYARNLVTITRAGPRKFDCWFTPDAPGNQAEVIDLPLNALQVFRETQTRPKFLSKIAVEEVTAGRRNQFIVRLRQESEFLRIKFDLINIPMSGERTLKSFALENGLRYVGQSSDHTVTIHVRVESG